MNDNDLIFLLIFGGIIVVLAVALGISTIANSVKAIFLEIGMPASVAGEMGAIIFAGIFLFLLLGVVRVVFS